MTAQTAQEAVAGARRQAERLLARRRRSEKELREALARRGHAPETAAEVIAALRGCGLVDDRAFAEAWVHDRQLLRPRSRAVLERELAARGIARGIARAVLDAMQNAGDDRRIAAELARAWLQRNARLPEATRVRRLAGYLQRRGFPAALALDVMRAEGVTWKDEG